LIYICIVILFSCFYIYITFILFEYLEFIYYKKKIYDKILSYKLYEKYQVNMKIKNTNNMNLNNRRVIWEASWLRNK